MGKNFSISESKDCTRASCLAGMASYILKSFLGTSWAEMTLGLVSQYGKYKFTRKNSVSLYALKFQCTYGLVGRLLEEGLVSSSEALIVYRRSPSSPVRAMAGCFVSRTGEVCPLPLRWSCASLEI